MSGGGKGGKSTTSVTIPAWVQEAAQGNLARADDISRIGYVPYMGPDVAAFQPGQMAAFQNTNDAANAFGMDSAMPNMPEPTTFAPGVQGYSSAPILEAAMNELQVQRPGQYDAITSQFIDPVTGQQQQAPQESAPNNYWHDPFGGGGGGNGSFGGGGGGGFNPFGQGNMFGDGGFFDDTPLDLGLIDGDGRLGFMSGGNGFGGGGGKGGGNAGNGGGGNGGKGK